MGQRGKGLRPSQIAKLAEEGRQLADELFGKRPTQRDEAAIARGDFATLVHELPPGTPRRTREAFTA
jgi:hypothetical protein